MIRLIVLAALFLFFNYASMPLGAGIYALIMLTGQMPVVGPVFRFLLTGPAPLAFPAKLLAWAISASGLLIALGLFYLLFGPPAGTLEYAVIFFGSFAAILQNMERSAFFNLCEPLQAKAIAKHLGAGKEFLEIFENMKYKLALQNYIDMNITNFFSLLVAYGLVLYSIGPLGLMEVNDTPLTLADALRASLSLVNIVGDRPTPYSGTAWEVLDAVAAFVVMVYLVLFISLGANLIEHTIKETAMEPSPDPSPEPAAVETTDAPLPAKPGFVPALPEMYPGGAAAVPGPGAAVASDNDTNVPAFDTRPAAAPDEYTGDAPERPGPPAR